MHSPFRNAVLIPGFASRAVLLLSLCFLLFPFPAFSEKTSDAESAESFDEWKSHVQKEVDAFMEDYRKHTADPKQIDRERETAQEKLDSFLDQLQKHSEDPMSAREKLNAWLEHRRQMLGLEEDHGLDKAVFQSKVFFGGWTGFFAILFILYVIKWAFNISLDGVSRFGIWSLARFGIRLGPEARGHILSPLSTAVREAEPPPVMERFRDEAPPGRGRDSKKKFLFCEVLLQFVNPFLNRDQIQNALEDQQQNPHPRPRIGELLQQRGVLTGQEVEDTLDKQKRYRKPRR